MTLTRREKIMIVVGLVVVTLAAYIFYFIIPFVNDTGAAVKKMSEAQAQIKLLNTKKEMSGKLTDEIASLEDQLKGRGAALPEGVDHARLLLYLKELTAGRAADVDVEIPKEPEIDNNFLTQAATLDFRTSYPEYLQIIAALKENKLYNRVTYLKTDYEPAAAEAPAAGGNAAETAPETPAPAAPSDKNVLHVHIELCFYALQPADGAAPAPALEPSSGERTQSLFPSR